MPRKITTEKFINRAIKVHGDDFDYSLVNYIGMFTKVKIICKVHGIFEQKPDNHLHGAGCRMCFRDRTTNNKLTIDSVLMRALMVHGDTYNYSLVNYVNISTKIRIICKIHGEFLQTPDSHFYGSGCPECGTISQIKLKSSTTEDFILKSIKMHGDRYDYSESEYIKSDINIKIICKIHGIFYQMPDNHYAGKGCPSCAKTGFDSNKPGYFYYIRFYNIKYRFLYKIGITNLTPNKRIKSMGIPKSITPTILLEQYFENGADAQALELSHKQTFKEFQYTGEPIMGNGNTELFIKDILELDNAPISDIIYT